jgi:hypothetical protein
MASLAAAALFAFFPNHGETHFWVSALPMNVLSTFFLLILAIAAIRVAKAAVAGQRMSPWSMVAGIACLCAMFTYDQVVPLCMVIISALAMFLVVNRKDLKGYVITCWVLCVAIFFILLLWKTTDAGGGPTFANLSAATFYVLFKESVRIWVSTTLIPLALPGGPVLTYLEEPSALTRLLAKARNLWDTAGSSNVVLSAAITFTLISACLVIQRFALPRRKLAPIAFSPSKSIALDSNILLALAGMTCWFLAYLPGYFWSLSPRHSYLPSVGAAMIYAALLDAPWSRRVLALALVAYLLFSSIIANLGEKNWWIHSYQARASLYKSLQNDDRAKGKYLALFHFPASPFAGAPPQAFLTQEQWPEAASIATDHQLEVLGASIHPMASESGYFIRTEGTRYGGGGVRHVARADALMLTYQGIEAGRPFIRYVVNGDEPPKPYRLLQMDSPHSWDNTHSPQYEVVIPPYNIKTDEVLALVGFVRRNGKIAPALTSATEDGEPLVVPIDVSGPRDGRAQSLRISLEVPIPKFDLFCLYLISRDEARLLKEIAIAP